MSPIENGLILHWEAMESLWDRIFETQQVNTEESRILLTEPPMNSLKVRKRMMEIMFERYNFNALNVSLQVSEQTSFFKEAIHMICLSCCSRFVYCMATDSRLDLCLTAERATLTRCPSTRDTFPKYYTAGFKCIKVRSFLFPRFIFIAIDTEVAFGRERCDCVS